MEVIFQNKVADSGLITIDLVAYIPSQIIPIDLKPFLFKELILKEKEFREQLKQTDFSIYTDCFVCIVNSTDAIIPMWAYMLLSTYLTPYTNRQFIGTVDEAEMYFTLHAIEHMDASEFKDERLIIKGCSDKKEISAVAYLAITKQLLPHARSIMYGEPCSNVPVFKRKKE